MRRWLCAMALVFGHAVAQEQELSLQSTVVGNQEQPKVIYIIPWQAPIGTEELQIRLGASFMEENFEHLEPEVLQRQLRYKDQLSQMHNSASNFTK